MQAQVHPLNSKRVNSQLKVLSLFISITIAILLVGCSAGGNHTKQASNAEYKNRISAGRGQIKYISQESLLAFVNRSHIVKINKKAGRPFNKLKYNKIIA
ncbi:MAG TPA: hypothetical protein VHS53_05265, partial [Mucilaginibacter sp.]|nr:hypothetical protein [Mucilaginibacter sp.]